MDKQTIELIADFICGDGDCYPLYRTGSELTRFFERVGFSNLNHDGSTRKWWTLSSLENLSENNLKAVLVRLANLKEYGGNKEQVVKAITKLNEILMVEGLKFELNGINPKIINISPGFFQQEEEKLVPLPPPDFLKLKIEPILGNILEKRWDEIQKCIDSGAYLSSTILMGSMLEGILLSVFQKYPKEANTSTNAPKDSKTGKVKHFADWSLSEMINVSHDLKWIGLDVKRFSHSLREFRNLIHPYQQMVENSFPDKDTCEISWLVVQAAANDLAVKLK